MAIYWTADEQRAVTDEGIRLHRAGKAKGIQATLALAQRVLPKGRRRDITSTAKVPWFTAALKAAAASAPDQARIDDQPQPATQASAAAQEMPQAVSATRRAKQGRVMWTKDEKQALCTRAARLQLDLQASGPRDALEKAMEILPPDRRRKIYTMTGVADWYPEGLQAARVALKQKDLDEAIAEAASAQVIDAAPAPADLPPAPPPPAPAAEPAQLAEVPQETPAQKSVPLWAAPSFMSPTPMGVLLGGWATLRENIVQEIAGIVAEGIHRGLASVRLTPPQQEQQQTDEPAPPMRHNPFSLDPNPKPRPPSVLVVGLKGGQVPQIQADFLGKLDLRFCSADKSKDQLRHMTEQADTTVVVTDFVSHSHTDIVKARAKHYIESAGGMTSLRQQLARIAGLQINGQAIA